MANRQTQVESLRRLYEELSAPRLPYYTSDIKVYLTRGGKVVREGVVHLEPTPKVPEDLAGEVRFDPETGKPKMEVLRTQVEYTCGSLYSAPSSTSESQISYEDALVFKIDCDRSVAETGQPDRAIQDYLQGTAALQPQTLDRERFYATELWRYDVAEQSVGDADLDDLKINLIGVDWAKDGRDEGTVATLLYDPSVCPDSLLGQFDDVPERNLGGRPRKHTNAEDLLDRYAKKTDEGSWDLTDETVTWVLANGSLLNDDTTWTPESYRPAWIARAKGGLIDVNHEGEEFDLDFGLNEEEG